MALSKIAVRVFEKAKPVRGKCPNRVRRDAHGNLICKSSYGKHSPMGWEIDHKKPKAKGGSNSLRNLQPLLTKDNRSKGCKHPYKKVG